MVNPVENISLSTTRPPPAATARSI
ncbi:uncharacterized protein METZ01_LOCUS17008 [marine metagenome]|uniref:Uncharacterized protein n=1 Tax=marine metagenome TaxID=408172 RepID=A0A381PC12_9ZZZZ